MSSPPKPPPGRAPAQVGGPAPNSTPPAPNAPRLPTPSPRSLLQSPRNTIPAAIPLSTSSGLISGAEAIVIYGPEGIGKSTLASYLPGVYVFDLEKSTRKLDVQRDSEIPDWPTLRGKAATFAQTPPPGIRTLVIDSGTVAQALAVDYVIASKTVSVKGLPPARVSSIEDFPFGRGWKYMSEEFDGLLADLERVRAKGINVCIVCHDARANTPNPAGEDFIRWEPNLYAGDKNQHGSVRNRVVGWAEHVLFVSYDVMVRDGKASGTGSRSICTYPLPTQVAKSRTAQVSEPFDIKDPGAIWRTLGIE